jgi:hypothetical protein
MVGCRYVDGIRVRRKNGRARARENEEYIEK